MDNKLEKIRHSLAHVLAAAVRELFPNVKLGVGPVIENGFYYDFDFVNESGEAVNFSPSLLPEIEKRMRSLIKKGLPVEQKFLDFKKALAEAKLRGQTYKTELLREIKSGQRLGVDSDAAQTKEGLVSFYQIGNFIDLCRGPHVQNTKELPIDGFKLLRLAGAYWRGSEKNKMLTRIYAAAFATKKELEQHLRLLAEAQKRDHKKLGLELDLFTFSDLVGSGLPLFTPRGTLIRNLLDDFVWELRRQHGYQQVDIPHLAKKDLYEASGHWDKFQDELFKMTTREGHLFVLKPMNCPHHIQLFNRRLFSYREMPQRYANTTKVYRDEQTGELSGLARVRSITQDDAHVFCRSSQVKEEILKIWEVVSAFYQAVGFNLSVRLSLHDSAVPQNYLGRPEVWVEAEKQLRTVVKLKRAAAEEAIGEAAFYGPKIDFLAKDSLERKWQVATIQLDMNLPERFDLACVNEKGERERVVMIHAAIMGSLERYLSILIEHFGGAFPLWLSPVQIMAVPISDKFNAYAQKIAGQLTAEGLRAEIDLRSESVGKKIREAELQKVPYVLVVGEKEQKDKTVAVRQRGQGDRGASKLERLIAQLQKEIKEKKS